MPIVESGTKKTDTSGKLWVVPKEVATKLIDAKDNFPAAVRVVFDVVEKKGTTVSLAVPVGKPAWAAEKTRALIDGEPPSGEKELRAWLVAGLSADKKMLANVGGGFIRSFLAPPGEHIGKLHKLRQHTRKDGVRRIWFTLINREGLTSDFSTPWPEIQCVKGDSPETDYIGPDTEFNSNKGPFPYLCKLGLDWKRFEAAIQAAPVLWDGHMDLDVGPLKSFFANIDDLTPELFAATKEHGLKWVKWTVIVDPKWGPQVERGDFFFNLTDVEIIKEDDPLEQEFQNEAIVFAEVWDVATKVLWQNDAARFLQVNGKPTTDYGDAVVRALIVPLISHNPSAVRDTKPDGSPKIVFPVKSTNWRLNGLVMLNKFAEALVKVDTGELFDLVNISDPDSDKLVAWAVENVPEVSDDLTVDEEEY